MQPTSHMNRSDSVGFYLHALTTGILPQRACTQSHATSCIVTRQNSHCAYLFEQSTCTSSRAINNNIIIDAKI